MLVGCHHNFIGREATVKGSDKTFGKWFGSNWIWLTVVGVMLSGVAGLGYKIFSTYAATFPYISNDHTAWASFGSLLAGFFTLTGTVATVATLLFLARQNKAMQKVNQAQLDSMTFERYINHRKLFIEQLHETISVHKGAFRFIDPNHLYNCIFTENSPHHCVFSVPPEYDDSGNAINHIARILSSAERIKYFLDNTELEEDEPFEFIFLLRSISEYILMIEPLGEARDGDVIFNGKICGFNIFSIEDMLNPCFTIINVIMKFTNNKLINDLEYQPRSKHVRKMLLYKFGLNEGQGIVQVYGVIKGIELLASAYYKSMELFEDCNFAFPKTVRILNNVFDSAASVNEMIDDERFNDVLDVCLDEVSKKVYLMGEGHKHGEAFIDLHNIFISLSSRKGFV